MTFTLRFELEKTTKGAVRYSEAGPQYSHKVGTLYIRKTALEDEDVSEPPKVIYVTVTEGLNG